MAIAAKSGAEVAAQPPDSRTTSDAQADLAQLESDLWEAADNLRANSKLTSSDYFMPVLGVIFLRHAASRFDAATRQIEQDQAVGKMPNRPVVPADYISRRALWLPEVARYDWIMERAAVSGSDLPALVNGAMGAIEDAFEPLQGVLPKDYGIFERTVLEDLLRLFNSDQVKRATGDVFGRIYEYFLAKFSIQKAHDNGEFFTPPSIVQTIVNVIEPDHGTILDPACGSGGMFVQSSHFIEHEGQDTAKRVVFYGQEKNRDTIRLALMNLAVHGLEGKIAEAITYYQDEHSLVEGCDFVMANPPFNVDLVDAERVKTDPRLPFGLPGVNKEKKVSNANYLWISYFWSYLNSAGRAGFVMSPQASGAGHSEKDVRRKIIQTGDVDVMIAIRPNFFYTRSIPCELWHFDRGKPPERRDKVLMIDARGIFRKVSRTVYDFSPEQLQNIAAIVWLYRGQSERFIGLAAAYLTRVCAECAAVAPALEAFDRTLTDIEGRLNAMLPATSDDVQVASEVGQAFTIALGELCDAAGLYRVDAADLASSLEIYGQTYTEAVPEENRGQHEARSAFDPHAESIRGLIKQVDTLYKLAARLVEQGIGLTVADGSSEDRRTLGRLVKSLESARKTAIESLRSPAYYHRQVAWLHERFPEARLAAVPGLVALVDLGEIEASDWSLSPARYVGVAPPEVDEDFDFEQTLRDIHTELVGLNREAVELAAKIEANFEEFGA